MTSWDYYVGFRNIPKSLDSFLDRQGYQRVTSKSNPIREYQPKDVTEGLIEISSFKAEEVKEGEVPDWRRSGFNVTSELMIATKDSNAADEALRLAIAIVRRYNSVLYDSVTDEYSRRNDHRF